MKYDFKNIIGCELTIKSMRADINHGRIGHAYVLEGLKGAGKRLLALTFAKSVLCEKGGHPCGVCKSCITLESGNHIDIIFVRSTKKTASLGIDDIRDQINSVANILPYASSRRIFIVENAESMTVSAQNALLKTLEDGPKSNIFLLLASNSAFLLPTILSRCVLYKIPPIPQNRIAKHLLAANVPQKTAESAAIHSGGTIGQAYALANDEGFTALCDKSENLAKTLKSIDIVSLFAAAKDLEQHKDQIGLILDILQNYYRNILIENLNEEINTNYIKNIRNIDESRKKLKQNCNFLLTMEIMLLKLSGKR